MLTMPFAQSVMKVRVPLISRVTLIAGFRHHLEQFTASVTQSPVKAATIVIIKLHN